MSVTVAHDENGSAIEDQGYTPKKEKFCQNITYNNTSQMIAYSNICQIIAYRYFVKLHFYKQLLLIVCINERD